MKISLLKNSEHFNVKTFWVFLIFSFAALNNPRDFPVTNLPLIYPAFIFLLFYLGKKNVFQAYKRVKFLCLLIFIYWCYLNLAMALIKGNDLILSRFARLIEPILILVGSGLASLRRGGINAATTAIVIVILFSISCGMWIVFIGEPAITLKTVLQSSIGGTIISGEEMREKDEIFNTKTILTKTNSGLSANIFSFSYQIAIGFTILILFALFSQKLNQFTIYCILLSLIIFVMGIITNAERITITSAPLGVLSGMVLFKRTILTRKFIIYSAIVYMAFIFLVPFSTQWSKERGLIQDRLAIQDIDNPIKKYYSGKLRLESRRRLIIVPLAAITTIFYEPFGAGGQSSHYENIAKSIGWIGRKGVRSSHNHYANIIMFTGLIGVIILIIFSLTFIKKVILVIKQNIGITAKILGAASITALFHAITHNTGFFTLEPATEIVLALFWAATYQSKNKKQLYRTTI